MKLTVVGCSGSSPGPESPASCYLVQSEHEGRTYSLVVDLGNGAPIGARDREAFERERDRLRALLDAPPPGTIARATGDTSDRWLP